MRRAFPLFASILVVAACAGSGDNAADSLGDTTGAAARRADSARTGGVADSTPATAALRNAAGREIGTLTLTETAQGISVSGHLTGLPAGAHGIHFHMVGQCTPPFESAGAHWNPTNKQHGSQ